VTRYRTDTLGDRLEAEVWFNRKTTVVKVDFLAPVVCFEESAYEWVSRHNLLVDLKCRCRLLDAVFYYTGTGQFDRNYQRGSYRRECFSINSTEVLVRINFELMHKDKTERGADEAIRNLFTRLTTWHIGCGNDFSM